MTGVPVGFQALNGVGAHPLIYGLLSLSGPNPRGLTRLAVNTSIAGMRDAGPDVARSERNLSLSSYQPKTLHPSSMSISERCSCNETVGAETTHPSLQCYY